MNNLKENGHEIVGCVQIRTFQLKRLRKYIKQYGWETVKAKFKSHILADEYTYLANETKPIKEYLKNRKISVSSINSYCKKENIENIKLNTINDKKFENFLTKKEAYLIVYAGGGIIRNNIIEKTKYGVLNAHSGWLPFFRGMNVIEWALLYGFRPYTTVHLIDAGIDTGRILFKESIPLANDLYTIRGNATVHNVELLTKIINNFSSYLNNSIHQEIKEGKQFFVMHTRLKNLVSKFLENKQPDINEKLKNNSPDALRFK
ncbi:MAG: formyltransferase family protein [Clostridia bacterium]|nr:formyltransferase family protein [Clostridia bacterium]